MTESDHPIRLLYLEDSSRDAEWVQDILANEGMRLDVTQVADRPGFEAAIERGKFDIVLVDFNLPGYDGVSALEFVRKRRPRVPVIVISGELREEDAVRCLRAGATDYLLKQRLDRLPKAVGQALANAEEQRKRLKAEEQIRKQADLLNKARDAIWVQDAQGRITFWNEGAQRLYGWTADEVMGREASRLFDQGRVPGRHRQLVDWVVERGEWSGEVRHVTKEGAKLIVESRMTLVRDSAGEIESILAINTDITEKKEFAENLLRSQRLESIGTLAGGIAHDLNNALAPILMAVDYLKQSYPDEKGVLAAMESSAVRGAEMVRQLLTFAKGADGEGAKRLAVQPERLLNEVVRIVENTFPKNIELRSETGRDLPQVNGDPTQMHQVLVNLCVNARDAMPDGGRLTLEVECASIDEAYAANHPHAQAGQYLIFRVTDTGVGIPPEVKERMFEPFFSTKSPEKGTGLGLSTVIGIVKNHGGFVEVYSVPDQGAVFAVHFPVAAATSTNRIESEKQRESFGTSCNGNGRTILVVDDDQAVRQMLEALLTAMNFEVVTTGDPLEGFVELVKRREDLGLLITDLHMPDMDGLTLARAVRRTLPNLGIVVVSGRLLEREARQLEALGNCTLLDKPFTQRNLIDAIRTVLPEEERQDVGEIVRGQPSWSQRL